MDFIYILSPLLGFLVAGGTKFLLNSFKAQKLAFSNIGMGGMPSTHNTITSSTFFTIGFGDGFDSPATAVAFMVCIIVGIDSLDLRQKIQQHAIFISKELEKLNTSEQKIRTKIGHNPKEVLMGWSIGALLGCLLSSF